MNLDQLFQAHSFSGHESFPLRLSWLKKGHDSLKGYSGIFSDESALVQMGVGKNMVRSIKHWGLSVSFWESDRATRGRKINLLPECEAFLGDEGWDPYLEEIGTIWWLHWRLITNSKRATSWSWLFGRPKSNRFTKEGLITEMMDKSKAVHAQGGKKAPSYNTLKRDVDVLVRSYTRAHPKKGGFSEDDLDSMFVLLGLVRPRKDAGEYELVQGSHSSLPIRIFEAALVDYCNRVLQETGQKQTLILLSDLLYKPGSPGRTFRLSETSFMDRLHQVVRHRSDSFQFNETAGLQQLQVNNLPAVEQVLAEHYHGSRGEE